MSARDPIQALPMVGRNQTKNERSPNDAEADVPLLLSLEEVECDAICQVDFEESSQF